MATTFRFPPSARDFELCRSVNCDGLSTWQAAKRFGISQMRVRQILRRVADWTAEVLPPQMEAEAAARLRLAEHIASDRLQHFYCETMEQWRATRQPRYLMQALRVTVAASKMVAPSGLIEALAADAIEGAEEGDRESGVGSRESVDPPVGDFSDGGEAAEEAPVIDEEEHDTNAERGRFFEPLRSAAGSGAAARSERTRSLLSASRGAAVTQIRIAPDQPGAEITRELSPRSLAAPQRELSRNERRRLQKKLKRAKGLT